MNRKIHIYDDDDAGIPKAACGVGDTAFSESFIEVRGDRFAFYVYSMIVYTIVCVWEGWACEERDEGVTHSYVCLLLHRRTDMSLWWQHQYWYWEQHFLDSLFRDVRATLSIHRNIICYVPICVRKIINSGRLLSIYMMIIILLLTLNKIRLFYFSCYSFKINTVIP